MPSERESYTFFRATSCSPFLLLLFLALASHSSSSSSPSLTWIEGARKIVDVLEDLNVKRLIRVRHTRLSVSIRSACQKCQRMKTFFSSLLFSSLLFSSLLFC